MDGNMERKLNIDVVNCSKNNLPLPKYANPGDAGMDLMADVTEAVVIRPFERKLIPTGLKMRLPAGYEAQVRPRSGLALKKGITVLNSPGTIDSQYIGEVGVILINMGQEDFVVNAGDRIAQMIIARHESAEWNSVSELESTERGDGGFGHTGV